MKFLRLLFVSIVMPFIAWAQSNYKAGYIVKIEGDTVKGYINYREWNSSPTNIDFKTTLTDKPSRIYPTALRSFEITGFDKYVSYIGLVSADKNTFPDLPYALDTSVVNDTLFLQVCYQGKPLSLLKQADNLKTRYFVSENNDRPVELKFYQYYVDNSTYPLNVFADQLKALAEKYNPQNTRIVTNIDRALFGESGLKKLLMQINNDQSKSNAGNFGSRLFLGILFPHTTTQFTGNNIFSGIKNTSYTPRLSVGYDLLLNKNTQKIYFRTELAGTYIKPRFKKDYNSYVRNQSYQFDQYNFSLSPQLVINLYNAQLVKAYINLGAAINYSVYSNSYLLTDASSSTAEVRDENYYELQKIWLNFPLQAGITLNKKIDIYALYTYPTAYTTYVNFSISNTVYGLGVRYLFAAK